MMTYVPLRHAIIYWSWHYYLLLHQRGSEEWDLGESCLPAKKCLKKNDIAGGIPSIFPLSPPHCVLLCPRAHRGMKKSSTNMSREAWWYLFSTEFIIQRNSGHCIYRCSDLCLAHTQIFESRGGTCGWPPVTFITGILYLVQLSVCQWVNKRGMCSPDCLSQSSQRHNVAFKMEKRNTL